MHPEVKSSEPGRCPKCKMRLVPEKEAAAHQHNHQGEKDDYKPLFVIIALILLATAAVAIKDLEAGTFLWRSVASNFMAGFFLVFAGFKLIDIRGFAEGYSTYDLLAGKVLQYGYVYPFIELAFGLAFLTSFMLGSVALIEIIVMAFSGLGVVRSMLKGQKIRCVCLGTILKVPLSSVTLVEDFGMVALGLAVLLLQI